MKTVYVQLTAPEFLAFELYRGTRSAGEAIRAALVEVKAISPRVPGKKKPRGITHPEYKARLANDGGGPRLIT